MRIVLLDFHSYAYSIPLASALSANCDVTLMVPDKVSAEQLQVLCPAVRLRQFRTWRRRYPQNIWMVASILREIAAYNPDVVHQMMGCEWMDLALPLLRQRPLVTTIHDAQIHPGDRESSSIGFNREWKCATQIIVYAEAIKRQLMELRRVAENKIHVVPHATYDFYLRWANSQVVEQENTILFFGRIWDYKGLQYLIEAEPLITARIPNARIVIAGRGDDFGKYERMMVNRDRFDVHNYRISDEMVARLFQEASLVVCPYIEASQSGVLAIANAFGKPVVATTVGGIPEMVEPGKTGLLVPPRDARSLADAIVRVLENQPLKKEMGQATLRKSQTDLSWASIAKQTMQVYHRAQETHAARVQPITPAPAIRG